MNRRSVDHAVLPVESLPIARARLTALGFTVAPDGNHPFGTSNCCVYLSDGTFLEPLAVADAGRVAAAIDAGNVFVARDQAYRTNQAEGFSALVLGADDAVKDHARFASMGISAGQLLEFSRPFVDSVGRSDRATFRLAFAAEPVSPTAFFFTCQRVRSPAVDRSALQLHRNGVTGLKAVIATARQIDRHAAFLAKLFGAEPDREGVIRLGDHKLCVLTPHAAEDRFGIADMDQGDELLLRGLVFAVSDLELTRSALHSAGVDCEMRGERLCVRPASGQGAFISFEADQ